MPRCKRSGSDWCGRLTGTWKPRDAHDPYWAGTVPGHSLMLGRNSYFALMSYLVRLGRAGASGSTAAQAWQPSLSHLHAPQITAFSEQINRLRGVFAVQRDGLFSTGIDVGVIVSDTFGRPWRLGIVNVALGMAGLPALIDLRGTLDDVGKPLHATVLAIADDVAAAAGIVMGKTGRTPVVIVRGLDLRGSGNGRQLVRPATEDLFR